MISLINIALVAPPHPSLMYCGFICFHFKIFSYFLGFLPNPVLIQKYVVYCPHLCGFFLDHSVINFQFNFILSREHTLYVFSPLKFVEAGFMAQCMLYFDEYFKCAQKLTCYYFGEELAININQVKFIDGIAQVCYILIDESLLFLAVIKREALSYPSKIVDQSVSPLSSTSLFPSLF